MRVPPALRPRRTAPGTATILMLALLTGCAAVEARPDATGQAATRESDATADAATGQAAADDADLLTTTPDEHSEVGGLVEGFPSDLLPLPADSALLVTSAVPVGEDGVVTEVSLNLTTPASVAEVLELYRSTLVGAGFTEVPMDATHLAAEATFTRSGGDELISLGVLDDGTRRTVTLGGRLRTGD